MSLRERWYRFKARPPGPMYSYVWWETLLGFYFIFGFLLFLFVFSVTGNWWFMVASMSHICFDFFWTRREINGRRKYRTYFEEEGE